MSSKTTRGERSSRSTFSPSLRSLRLPTKILSILLSFIMAFSCSSNVLMPLGQAWASSQDSAQQTETIGDDATDGVTGDTTGTGIRTDVLADTSDVAGIDADTSTIDVDTTVGNGATSEGETVTDTTTPDEVIGDLPVSLSFTLDGDATSPVPVRLQLQSRTATWNADESTWTDYGAWTDVDSTFADLTADAETQYTFKDLELQTVTETGAYATRTQYRTIASKVDGADLAYESTSDDGIMSYTAAAAMTDSKSTGYVVSVSQDPALYMDTDETGADIAKLSDDKPEAISLAGTTAVQPTPVTPVLTLSPQTADHTVTFSVNGGTSVVAPQTVPDGDVATKPVDPTISGATFINWYGESNPTASSTAYDFSTPVTADVTLTALLKWNYTVTNTTYNYADGDTTNYKLSKDAQVTINGTTTTVTAETNFAVPANATFTIACTSPTDGVTVTVMPDTSKGQSVIGATTATLKSTAATATLKSQEPAANINLYKKWMDGSANSKPALDLSIQFSADAGTTWNTLTAANMATLGLTSVPTIPDHSGNNDEWSYSFSKLLPEFTITGEEVIYRLTENTVPANYVSSYTGVGGNTLVNTELNAYSATKKWADGGNKYGTRIDVAAWVATLTCKKASLSGEDENVALTLTDSTAEGYIVVTQSGNSWSISMPNARGYDASDFPYSYYLVEPESTAVAAGSAASDGTVYKPTYKNDGNYASIDTALYSGGTVTNALTNNTKFSGTKKWADDNSTEIATRPTATIYLFRYPDDGTSSYENASPVPGVAAFTLDNQATESFTFSLPTGTATLPAYDEAGNKYIYFAKETLAGGSNTYKRVFKNNGSEKGNDTFLFNGGELDNTITGEVSESVTKKWAAASRQDVDAKVTISIDQYDYQGNLVKAGYVTQDLTGFGTENPSQTADFSGLPMYDENGRKYTYKVSESSLQTEVGGTLQNCTMSADGTSFVTADGYRYTTSMNTDGNKTTITNTLVGNAQVTITKSFPNGLLVNPTDLTYTIYQNGTKIGTKTVSYSGTVGSAITPDPVTIANYSDMDEGSYVGSGLLPRYDGNGVQYTYTVSETSRPSEYAVSTGNRMMEGTYAEGTALAGQKYSYDDARISNSKPVESMGVSVHKSWIDASDVMNREVVHLALQYNAGTAETPDWVTINTGSIDPSTDYTWVSVPKTVPEGSTGTATYQDLYRAWIAAGRTIDAAGAFRVVETALGNDAVVADGDASIPTDGSSGHRSGYSFVSTANQNYDVSSEATIISDYGYALTNTRVGTEKITLTKNWVDGNDAKVVRPTTITFTVTASSAVFTDAQGAATTTKDFTATGTGNTWTLDTGWLQKYDSTTGAFITYTVAESADSTTTVQNLGYAISGKQTSYTVGEHHTGDVETWEFTNTLSGSVVPLMNKIWKDLGDSATIRNRPDIYPVLIRSYTDDSGTHYEKMTYQDRDWNTNKVTANWWQCTFVSQPRYNAEGYEYTYYVAEAYSSSSHGDYVTSGGYTNAPNADGSFTEDPTKLDSITVDGTTYSVARLNNTTGTAGTIVNKPVATRIVSGQKLWAGLPAGFSKSNLPEVSFELYRCSYAYRDDPMHAPDLTDVGASATLKSGASTFSFFTPVPRYDEEGKPYTYVVKETKPTTMDVVYDIAEDPLNGLVVTNSFKVDQGYAITFTKNWSGVPSGLTDSQKPNMKLTLVRYLTSDAAGTMVIPDTRAADFATEAGNTHANATTITSDITSVGWNNLAYYGPNGNPYKYVVEESSVPDGYVVYDAAGTSKVTAVTDAGATAYEAVVTPSVPTTGTPTSGTAGLTNKYGEVLGKLSLTKDWVGDQAYAVSPRPSSIHANLYRTSTSGGKELVQSNVELDSADGWVKTLEGLEVYSPNGEQYAYSFVEVTVPTGYSAAYSPETAALSTTDTAALKATNTVDTTSLTVTKAWTYDTSTDFTPSSAQLLFGAKISGIPASIVYRFQYSTDGGANWTVLNDKDGNPVAKTISQAGDGSFGTTNLTGLPTYTMVGATSTATMYRAFEYSLTFSDKTTETRTSTPGTTDSGFIGDVVTAGSGTTTAGATTTGTTATTNTIPVRKITVTKTWDDEYNRDGVRPSSISFDIKRTGVETTDDSQTETVTLTATNKTDDNTWSADYYVPVYWNVDTTTMSSYTVTEDTTTSAAKGYTAYAGASADPTTAASNVDIAGATSDASAYFKNSRVHGTYDVAIAKKWKNGTAVYDGTTTIPTWLQAYLPTSLTFRLQVSTDGTNWSDVDPTSSDFTGVDVTKTATVTKTNGAISPVSWAGLPKYASDTITTNLVTYHYRVIEDLVAPQSTDFQTTYSSSNVTAAGTVTVTNSLNVTKLAMTKAWSDQNNNCNTRPDAIRYTAQYSTDGITWTTVPDSWTNGVTSNGTLTVTKAKAYNATLDMLPEYESDGVTKYQYRAVETALVYGTSEIAPGASESDAKPYYVSSTTTSSDTGGVTTYTTAFTNTLVYTAFSVTKHWVDSTPSIAGQVSEIRYYLQQSSDNGTTWTYVLGSDGTTKDFWSIVTSGSTADASKTNNRLPKYDSAGYLYQYRAIENLIVVGGKNISASYASTTDPTSGTVGGFTFGSVTSGSSTVITNTAVTTGMSASKVWKANSGGNSTLPSTITFHLKQGTTTLGATFDRTLSDPWSAVSWTGLPASNAAGTAYNYSVAEDQVPGYTAGIAGTQAAGYTVTNTPIPVNISKVASDGTTKLAGATFTLTGTFTNRTGEETRNWTSSATDTWNLTGLLVQNNVYTLVETAPPTGYTLPGSTTTYLKVKDDGKLYKDTSATGTFATAVTGNALAVTDAATKVTITKTDGTKNLAGARFTVTGTFVDATDQTKTTPANTTITTDANPFVLTGRLIAGNVYTIDETTAPDGYLTMQSSFTVTMGTDGHLTADTLPTGVNVAIGYDAANGATVTVADQPTVLKAVKYESTDTAHATPIAGAVFTVTPVGEARFADNTTAAKTITSTNSATNLGNLTGALITGEEYTIQETTAAPGYALPSSNPAHTIQITNAGQLQENVGGTWTDITGNAMTFEDATTSVTLVKQDKATSAQIGDSTYTLTATGTGTFADGSSTQKLSPTTTDVASLIVKMRADDTTTYTLRETVSPAGYKLNRLTDSYGDATITGGAMTLKMDTVGQLYYASSAQDGWTKVEDNALVMKDAKTSLTIKKILPDGTAAKGTFTIHGVFADSDGAETTETIVDDATSGTMTGNLIAGNSYSIVETVPPAGYNSVSDFSFTMNTDGTVTRGNNVATNPALAYDDSDNPTFTATDYPTKITLTKTGAAGNLSGAVFTITPTNSGTFADGSTSMTWNTSTDNAKLYTGTFRAGTTYTFHEETIPNGYKGIPDFQVQLDLHNTLTLETASVANTVTIANPTESAAEADRAASITIANTQNSIRIVKSAAGAVDPTAATFTINGTFTDKTDATKTITETRIYSAGTATLTGEMIAGQTYTVTETVPPSSYQTIPSSFQVKMGADGKLTAVGTLPTGVLLSSDGLTLTITDPQNTFTLAKKGADDAIIGGAVFTLTDTTANAKLADGTASYQFTTTAGNKTTITGKLIASTTGEGGITHTYKLEETTPAPGYTLAGSDTVYLRVDTAGNLSSCSTADGTFETVSDNALTLTDTQNSISIFKGSAPSITADKVAGANFSLVGTFATQASPITWTSSDTDAKVLTGELVAGNEYLLTETSPVPGRVISSWKSTYNDADLNGDALVVRIDDAGNLAYRSSDEGEIGWTNFDENVVVMYDARNDFRIVKDGGLTSGFTITPAEGSKLANGAAYTAVRTGSSAQDGKISGLLVAGNTYEVTEYEAPLGCVLAPTFSIKVSDDGSKVSLVGAPSFVSIDSDGVTMNVTDAQNKVTLKKVDTGGATLSGATFEVWGRFADGKTKLTLDGTNTITGKFIAGESYAIYETTAPAGYLTVPDFAVKMGSDGKLTAVRDLPTGGRGTVTLGFEEGVNTITVSDVEDAFTLEKVDERGSALGGATFTVVPAEGKTFADGTSDPKTILSGKSSEKWTDKLITGITYTFTETTSPAAYVTMDPFTVTIAADGTITVGGAGADAVSVDGTTITAKNSPMTDQLTLHKVDATDGSAITSMKTVFTITVTPSGSTSSVTFEKTTDENGDLILTNMAKGTWTITEKTPDPNYVNYGFSCTFTVTDACQGKTLTINSNSLGTETPFNLTVTNDDEDLADNGLSNVRVLGTVNIKKLGVGDDVDGLDGVRFELYKKTDQGYKLLIASTTTGTGKDSGTLSFVNLPWGDYYVVETDVPDGYKVDSTRHDFTIGYGALTKDFTDTSAITNDKNTFTLTKNEAGATFEMAGTFATGTSPITFTGATSYTEVGRLVGGNTYTVTETVPPAGYKVVPQFQVTMSEEGVLSAAEGTTLPNGVTIENNVISVNDAQNSFTVEKDNEKQGDKKAKLGGVTFELRTADTAATLVDTWTTDIDDNTGKDIENPHSITGKLTAGVVYRLTETSPSFGYTTTADTFLKMDNSGQLWSDTSATGAFSTKVDGNALVIADTPTSLSFTKLDADGKTQLAGAWLRFTADIGYQIAFDMASNSTETVYAKGRMAAGYEYAVSELMPAPGHIISPWTDTYSDAALNESGDLIVKMENPGQLQYKTTAGTDTWADIKDNAIIMTDAQTSVSIGKVDSEGAALAGAQFELSGVDGATFANATSPISWTSGTVAYTITGELSAGSVYKLSETTPAAGYTVAADVYLSVDSQGILHTSSTDAGPWSVVTDNALAVSDTQTDITITKADATGAALAGSTFNLSGTFADGSTTVTWTSSDTAYDFKGELITGNIYKLVETNPTEGYRTAADVYLKVDDAGVLWTCSTSDGEFQKADSDALVVRDLQTSFTFGKVNDGDEPLTGATFKIDGVFADGSTSMDLFSGNAVANVTGKMIAGNSYTVTETVIPAGYTAIDPFVVTVSADGSKISVSPAAGSTAVPSGVTVAEDGFTVKVMDDPVAIIIQKTDRNTGKQLVNHKDCTFKITPVGDTTFADGSTTPITGNDDEITAALRGNLIVSDTSSSVPVEDRHVYSIQEVQEPGGYAIEKAAVNFIVNQYGDVFALNGEGTIITSAEGTPNLSFSDSAIVTNFEKTDADGTMIDGATFTVTGTFADGTTSKTVSPTAGTVAAIEGQIIAGDTYTLTETITPSGYVTLASPISFTVDSLGMITITGNPEDAASVGSDGMTLIVKNSLTPAGDATGQIPKTGDDSPFALIWMLGGLGVLSLTEAGFRRRKRSTRA